MKHNLGSKEGDHYMRALLAWNRHLACSKAISSSGVSRLDQIDQPKSQKTALMVKQPVVIEDSIRYTKYFFEHQKIKKTTEVSDVFLALLTPDDHVAGDEGFEPPNAGTRTQCLTTWRIPNKIAKSNKLIYP